MTYSQEIICRRKLATFLILVCALKNVHGVCVSTDYFGPSCRYRCWCNFVNCDVNGNCLRNSSCFEDYFGPQCQYRDMVDRSAYPPDWIHDRSVATCSPGGIQQQVRVNLSSATVMTWLRIEFNNPQRLGDAQQSIQMKLNGTVDCTNLRVYVFQTGIVDVSCDNVILITSIVFTGRLTSMMCNVFVSGGRNVAHYQNATIIGDAGNYTTRNPVDNNYYCPSRTNDVATSIIITHDNPHLLYTIIVVQPYGATANHRYTVKTYMESNLTISHTEQSAASELKIFLFDLSPFTTMSIDFAPKLQICEVQIFGVRDAQQAIHWKLNGTVDCTNMRVYKFQTGILDVSCDNVMLIKSIVITSRLTSMMCSIFVGGETWCQLTRYGFDCEHQCQCLPNEICFPPTGMCGLECPPGSYGFLCSLRCGRGCATGKCDYRTGHCKCSLGFYDDGVCLTACPVGTYGANCTGRCSGHCQGTTDCNRANGTCTACANGFFGSRCQFSCPTKCKNNVCNMATGKCSSCVDGYFGFNCSIQCSDGCLNSKCNFTTGGCFSCKVSRFGTRACQGSVCVGTYLSCHNTCGVNCLNQECDQRTGKCVSCAPGHVPPNCAQKDCPANCKTQNGCNRITDVCNDCKVGHFGASCQFGCPRNCLNTTCDRTTGRCILCQTGFFDMNCSSSCPAGCLDSVCDQSTGSCLACKPSQFGIKTCYRSECNGTVLICDQNCSEGCVNRTCNQTSGVCSSCSAGYEGPACQPKGCPVHCKDSNGCNRVTLTCSVCVDGFYGASCQLTCPDNCLNKMCDKDTGHCFDCITQYYGSNCSKTCSTDCLNSACNSSTGGCFQCQKNKYGERSCMASECEGTLLTCTETCRENCLNQLCNQTSGDCLACAPGFELPLCQPVTKESASYLWLALLILPLLLAVCAIVAWCFYKKKRHPVAEEETKTKLPNESPGSSWTFATSYVTVSYEKSMFETTSVQADFPDPDTIGTTEQQMAPAMESKATQDFGDQGSTV